MPCLALCIEEMLRAGNFPGKHAVKACQIPEALPSVLMLTSTMKPFMIILNSVVYAGALEQAMQEAESQGVLSSSDELHIGSRSSSSKYRRSEGRPAKGIAKNKAKGNIQSNRRQESLPQVIACDVTKTGTCGCHCFFHLQFLGWGAIVCKCTGA